MWQKFYENTVINSMLAKKTRESYTELLNKYCVHRACENLKMSSKMAMIFSQVLKLQSFMSRTIQRCI